MGYGYGTLFGINRSQEALDGGGGGGGIGAEEGRKGMAGASGKSEAGWGG